MLLIDPGGLDDFILTVAQGELPVLPDPLLRHHDASAEVTPQTFSRFRSLQTSAANDRTRGRHQAAVGHRRRLRAHCLVAPRLQERHAEQGGLHCGAAYRGWCF